MKKGLIYCLICPISKEYRYVGKTIRTLKKRLAEHKADIFRHLSYKNNWLKKLHKLNLLEELQIVLIEKCNVDILNEREIYWIDYFKSYKLTNSTIGGEGSNGYKHTIEAKEKISKAGKKRKGEKRSDSARKNVSLSLIGNTRHKDKPHTEETKNKIRETKTGCMPPNRKKVSQYTKDNVFIKTFISTHHASKELNINQGNISEAANGKRKTCGGFIWKYNTN